MNSELQPWNQPTEEINYTKLGEGDALALPKTTLKDDSVGTEIGRWGEQLVWEYLQKLRSSDVLVEDVIWPNEASETGKPYDFEILYKTENVDEVYSVFVEVSLSLFFSKQIICSYNNC